MTSFGIPFLMTSWKNVSSAWPPSFSSWFKEWCFKLPFGIHERCIWSQCAATWSVTLFIVLEKRVPNSLEIYCSESHKSPDCFSSVLKRLDKLPPPYKSIFFIPLRAKHWTRIGFLAKYYNIVGNIFSPEETQQFKIYIVYFLI